MEEGWPRRAAYTKANMTAHDRTRGLVRADITRRCLGAAQSVGRRKSHQRASLLTAARLTATTRPARRNCAAASASHENERS